MKNSWPPVMHVNGIDIKRCLGDPDMDIRTVRSRLLKLGFKQNITYIDTSELIEKVKSQNKEGKKIICRYKPKSIHAMKL